jgi:hypothetical protein
MKIVSLGQAWRGRGNEDHSSDTARAVTRGVTYSFHCPHRMGDERDALDTERFDDGGKIIGESVCIIASAGILRRPMPTSVIGNGAEACAGAAFEMKAPGVRREAPGGKEEDGGPLAMIPYGEAHVVARQDSAVARGVAHALSGVS